MVCSAERPEGLRALAAGLGRAVRHAQRRINGYDDARFLSPVRDVLSDIGDTLQAFKERDAEKRSLSAAPAHVVQEIDMLRSLASRGSPPRTTSTSTSPSSASSSRTCAAPARLRDLTAERELFDIFDATDDKSTQTTADAMHMEANAKKEAEETARREAEEKAKLGAKEKAEKEAEVKSTVKPVTTFKDAGVNTNKEAEAKEKEEEKEKEKEEEKEQEKEKAKEKEKEEEKEKEKEQVKEKEEEEEKKRQHRDVCAAFDKWLTNAKK